MDWKAVQAAYELVASGTVNRVDGSGWKIYRVGGLVRLDITI